MNGYKEKWNSYGRNTLKKVILVRECEVIRVFDLPVDLRKVFNDADKLCKGKDWHWSYIPAREWEMIGWNFLDSIPREDKTELIGMLFE